MRIGYRWTEIEWNEAVRLANRRPGSRGGTPLPGLMWPLIVIPMVGAVGDLGLILGRSHTISLRGSVMPLLLVLLAGCAAVSLWTKTRRRRTGSAAQAMPAGKWEATLQESGWKFCPEELSALAGSIAGSDPTLEATAEQKASASSVPGTGDALPAEALLHLRPWSDMVEARRGDKVIVFMLKNGFDAFPTGTLTPEQGGHMHRLVNRKLRRTKLLKR